MDEYIDKNFRRRFVIRFLLGLMLISALSGFLFYFFLPQGEHFSYISLIHSLFHIQASLFPLIIVVGFIDLFLAGLFTLCFVLFMSHKVGGPLFRLIIYLEQLKRRNFTLPEINLRFHDQGKLLAQRVNEMMMNWRVFYRELKISYGKFNARLSLWHKDRLSTDMVTPEQREALARAKHELEKFEKILDRFGI